MVELSLFCAVYNDKLWDLSPMKADNNVNGVGKGGRLDVYNLKDKELTDLQEALVRKIVGELKDYDNLYYEICNEPYFGGVTKEWNDRIADVIADAEKGLPARHLIAQNISNGSAKVERTEPERRRPQLPLLLAAGRRRPQLTALNRAVGFDETGFRGTADLPYRTDAWDFLIAGGAVYSNLDYSYSPAHPDGTAKVTTSPGGGGIVLRRQLTVLKEFMDGFDFVHMKPDNGVVRDGRITLPLAGTPAGGQGDAGRVGAGAGRKRQGLRRLCQGRGEGGIVAGPTEGDVQGGVGEHEDRGRREGRGLRPRRRPAGAGVAGV